MFDLTITILALIAICILGIGIKHLEHREARKAIRRRLGRDA